MKTDSFLRDSMRSDIFNSVKLRSGQTLNYNRLNPDDLSDDVKSELSQLPASQLDILYVRKNIHSHSDSLQQISGNIGLIQQDIIKIGVALEKALWADVSNGKPAKKLISEIIAEMYQRESLIRDVSNFFQILGRHKRILIGTLIIFIVSNLVIGDKIKMFLDAGGKDIWKWITTLFGFNI